MVTVYIVRHCEAQGNLTKRFQGQIDHDITETGALQLKYLAKRFDDVHIDKIYSSPLVRARKTAQAVADTKGLPVILDDGLKELHVGMFENMLFEDFKKDHKQHCENWINTPWNFEAPKGESMRSLYERMWTAVQKIAAENQGKTVLITSHGCAIRNLLCRVLYNDIERMCEIGIGNNTAVTKLIFEKDNNVRVEYCSDYSHLPESALPESSRFDSKLGDKK